MYPKMIVHLGVDDRLCACCPFLQRGDPTDPMAGRHWCKAFSRVGFPIMNLDTGEYGCALRCQDCLTGAPPKRWGLAWAEPNGESKP